MNNAPLVNSRPPALAIQKRTKAAHTHKRRSSLGKLPQRFQFLSSKEFTQGFVAPDYLIDGVMQRSFFYSLTGATGGGKTAIALVLAAHIALGRPLGGAEVTQGRVLYLAGENSDDLRMRWIAMSEHEQFDSNNIDVHFLDARISISKSLKRLTAKVEELGGVSLIIIDTSAAYFEGKDENDTSKPEGMRETFDRSQS